jgi:hypothetical protein
MRGLHWDLIRGPLHPRRRGRFANHQGWPVGLSIELATAVSIVLAVSGGAGYCGADEVLPVPRVHVAQPLVSFSQGPFRFFPGYGSANGVQTIDTGAAADDAPSSPRPWHRRGPVFRRLIFMSCRDLVALVCWSRRSSSYIGQKAGRSCSRPPTWLGVARRQTPRLFRASVFAVIPIPWLGGA